jgi:hypothetical protein
MFVPVARKIALSTTKVERSSCRELSEINTTMELDDP